MITNKWVLGKTDFEDIRMIRKKVFIEEQHVPEEEEMDEMDHYSLHLVIYVDEAPAATGRIYHDGSTNRIGRIAVLKEFRGQGIGDLLIRLLLFRTFETDAKEIVIDAQSYISHVYEKFGFTYEGEEFMDAGIPHKRMRLKREDFKLPSQCGNH